ncbi:cytidyltransferase [Pseudomonas floridensis]|uniref:nicotinate-nucleotide adenylyltransferase n=1 Tax=Pseudomonas floridensis TaxID=1958950 RepID=A0A1X0N4X4_9PSED|nr:adenylyltransferase/cytidyltransferase family protein [Pseudomonas floridensis]ORC58441.1 cytidyltransferase [Pseudomonas floridensis]
MYEIAVYGGAFNPPHAGHANVMIQASRQARFTLVVPSFQHPYGKVMVDFELRLEWLRQVTDNVRQQCSGALIVSDIERELCANDLGPVFSFNLLTHICASTGHAPNQIALVVGQDVADALPGFYLGPELLETFSVITVPEQAGVRSTAMREQILQGAALPPHWIAPGMDPLNYRIYAAGVA